MDLIESAMKRSELKQGITTVRNGGIGSKQMVMYYTTGMISWLWPSAAYGEPWSRDRSGCPRWSEKASWN